METPGLILQLLVFCILVEDRYCRDKLDGGPAILIADHHEYVSRVIFLRGSGTEIYDYIEEHSSVQYGSLLYDPVDSEKTALTFDYEDKLLIWSDPGKKAIVTLSLGTGSLVNVYSGTSSTVEGVAVDWVTNNIYWTDAEYNWIKISNYAGTHSRTLITTDLDHPTGIVCNPSTGYLYWADAGEKFRIERATLSGENRTVLVDQDMVGADVIGRPASMTMDYANNVLYWCDSLNGRIVKLDLNDVDASPETVVHDSQKFGELFGIDFDPNFGLFVTDRENNHVHIVPHNTRKAIFSIITEYHEPNGIVYYQADKQPVLADPCENAACTHLCVSDPAGYKCMCSQEYKLDNSGTKCVIDNNIISDHELIVSMAGGYLCQLPANAGHIPELSTMVCFDLVSVGSMDFDVHGNLMFATRLDRSNDQIWETRLQSALRWRQVVVLPEQSDIRGIAIDWLSFNMYWTDAHSRSIGISKQSGAHRKSLITKDIEVPSAIAVHAKKMYLFWSDTGTDARIERSGLHGRQRKVIVGYNVQLPTHLAIDFTTERLYWSDDGTHTIESVDFEGLDRQVLVTSNQVQFAGISIFQDIMFVAQRNTKYIVIYNVQSGNKIRTLIVEHELTAIRFFHESLQPLSKGPCDFNNGGCEHVCINTEDGAECVCSDYQLGVCTPEIRCPLKIPSGQMSDTCDNRNERSCHFSCSDDFVPSTEDVVQCTDSGEWSIPSSQLCLHVSCVDKPCLNGGICTGTESGYNCSCLEQWSGDNCEIRVALSDEDNSAVVILGVLVAVFATAALILIISVMVIIRRNRKSGSDTELIIPRDVRYDNTMEIGGDAGIVNQLYFSTQRENSPPGPATIEAEQFSGDAIASVSSPANGIPSAKTTSNGESVA